MILLGRKKKSEHLLFQGREAFNRSVSHALNGIEYTINHERNIKIQILFAIMACILGFLLNISAFEWVIIVLVIAMVISLELVNTAIERAIDLVTKDYNELAKVSKDVAAGAVLVMSLFSVVIGIVIFLPKLITLVK